MRLSFRPVTFLIAAIAGLLVSGGATASDAAAQFELGLQASVKLLFQLLGYCPACSSHRVHPPPSWSWA